MILDHENLYCENQAITADAASTNIIDHGQAGYGDGEKIPIVICITEDFNTLTSLDVVLQTDDVEGFGTPTQIRLASFLLAELVAGAVFQLELESWQLQQYSRLNFDVQGTNPTTGQITAGVTPVVQTNVKGRMDQYGQLG